VRQQFINQKGEVHMEIPATLHFEFTSLLYSFFEQWRMSAGGKCLKQEDEHPLKQVWYEVIREVEQEPAIHSLLFELFQYDRYTFRHSMGVTLYSLAVALKSQVSPLQVKEIGLGAILHDIGKLHISLKFLNKKGKLNPDEYETIQKHAEWGFQQLSTTDG